jgi:hypothetical protein
MVIKLEKFRRLTQIADNQGENLQRTLFNYARIGYNMDR